MNRIVSLSLVLITFLGLMLVYDNWQAQTSQEIINQFPNIMMDMPITYQNKIKAILSTVNPDLLKSLEKIVNKPDSTKRWLAWSRSIYLNLSKIQSDEELRRVLIHELWHIIDLWYLKSKKRENPSPFMDWSYVIFNDDPSVSFYSLCWANSTKQNWNCSTKDFVSWYAWTDPFEDFAESWLLYKENNAAFLSLAQESKILKAKYLLLRNFTKTEPKTKAYKNFNKDKREWDLTLAF